MQTKINMNSFWINRTAFVTGATGFVGAHIVRHLVEKGAKVICLQHDAVRANSLQLFNLNDKVTFVNGSIEDFPLLERIINKYEIDAVFHLAAQALVGAANRSPLSTFEANIRGTYLLLEACRQSEIVKRIVVASSYTAYGDHSVLPYHEDFPLQGRFPYPVSKSCADLISQSFAHSYGLPVTVTRAANTYGPGDINLSRIIPGTITSILKKQNPIIRSDGTPIREFIHVDDVAEATLLLAENIEKSQGEAFNIGADEPVKMLDLVNLMLEITGAAGTLSPQIMLKNKIDREIDEQYISVEKINRVFGWSAKISLRKGLSRTIDWYRENLAQLK